MAQEKNYENAIKRYLKSKGIYRLGAPGDNPQGYWVKRHGGSVYVASGLPDMQIVIGATCIELEIKSDTGRLSALQDCKLRQINNAGGIGIVTRPSEFEEFKKMIERIIDERTKI